MRKSIHPHTSVAACTTTIRSLRALEDRELSAFQQIFHSHGFAILHEREPDGTEHSLAGLERYFGVLHHHDRSSHTGVAPIEFDPNVPGYLGTSNEDHPPHTDETFESRPSKVMCLQCIRNASEGGDSILVSGASVFEHLRQNHSTAIASLFDNDALTVERKGHTFTGPVFTKDTDRYFIRFRSDNFASLRVKESATAAFEAMRKFVLSQANQLRFQLLPCQTLVVDNTAILHGRTSFTLPSARKLHRVNFDGNANFCATLGLGFDIP